MGLFLKNSNRTNLNAYLFANLVILCILLISLWNKKPVWDVSLRFPNLLLILVIINSILIFKGLILAKNPAEGDSKKKLSDKTSHNLNSLRKLVIEANDFSDPLLDTVVSKIRRLANSQSVTVYMPANDLYQSSFSAGDPPPALAGARLAEKGKHLTIKFPGNLGEEDIGILNKKSGVINFVSSITRLEFTLFPLRLKNKQFALLIFSDKDNHTSPRLNYTSLALYLETILAFRNMAEESGDLRYKDKSLGLLNYSCFADSFETEIERSERYQQDMTLFAVKLTANTELTSEENSRVRKAVAESLKQSLRRLDLMFCGEQNADFYAILTETSAQIAQIVAKRVQKSFAKQLEKLEISNKDNLKLFIGSASYPENATHSHGLLEKSQEALSQAEQGNEEFVSYKLIE
jgi:diguanylate cyclase (GGDEF)-like protein